MKYSKILRKKFSGISLGIDDLLLLESFQINYLPERVPKKEFAALIREYPIIRNFLIIKNPSIEGFIQSVLKTYEDVENKDIIKEYCDAVLWEIADLIVYNKHPEIYDEKVNFCWRIEEIVAKQELAGKIVADVGAGSGRLAFQLAQFAKTVYAIEPISAFRSFVRQKAEKENYCNVFIFDGFLESIPLPENSLDILFTSNAIGWNIKKELQEIERVVKPNGQAIHIMRLNEDAFENPVHEKLISKEWNYEFCKIEDNDDIKVKYYKSINGI